MIWRPPLPKHSTATVCNSCVAKMLDTNISNWLAALLAVSPTVEEFLREAKEKFEEQWKNQSQVTCFPLLAIYAARAFVFRWRANERRAISMQIRYVSVSRIAPAVANN